jgi:predicted Zn-ribbon and HTH transcriptional regulator
MKDIMSIELSCEKCGYTWRPRVQDPKECPNCKTRRHNWRSIRGERETSRMGG